MSNAKTAAGGVLQQKKRVLKNFAKLTGTCLCQSQARNFTKKEIPTFDQTFFNRTPPGQCFWI